jgi:hypothetical protein
MTTRFATALFLAFLVASALSPSAPVSAGRPPALANCAPQVTSIRGDQQSFQVQLTNGRPELGFLTDASVMEAGAAVEPVLSGEPSFISGRGYVVRGPTGTEYSDPLEKVEAYENALTAWTDRTVAWSRAFDACLSSVTSTAGKKTFNVWNCLSSLKKRQPVAPGQEGARDEWLGKVRSQSFEELQNIGNELRAYASALPGRLRDLQSCTLPLKEACGLRPALGRLSPSAAQRGKGDGARHVGAPGDEATSGGAKKGAKGKAPDASDAGEAKAGRSAARTVVPMVAAAAAGGVGAWYALNKANLTGGASCGPSDAPINEINTYCFGSTRNTTLCNQYIAKYDDFCRRCGNTSNGGPYRGFDPNTGGCYK